MFGLLDEDQEMTNPEPNKKKQKITQSFPPGLGFSVPAMKPNAKKSLFFNFVFSREILLLFVVFRTCGQK